MKNAEKGAEDGTFQVTVNHRLGVFTLCSIDCARVQ